MINKILDDQEDATIDRLLGLIDKSPTAFHAADQLGPAGFRQDGQQAGHG